MCSALMRCNKSSLIEEFCQRLQADLELVMASQRATQEGATHEESRAENDKDTRATESSYLARGQAKRVAELSEAIARLRACPTEGFDARRPISCGAIVELKDDNGVQSTRFLVPAGGGLKALSGELPVQALSLASPLAQALLGCLPGDSVEVETPRGLREYAVVAIA